MPTKIEATTQRCLDNKIIRVLLRFENSETKSISFMHDDMPIHILSSSSGLISKNTINVSGVRLLQCFLDYRENLPSLHCVISYLEGDSLSSFEHISVNLLGTAPVESAEKCIKTVNSVSKNFETCQQQFLSIIKSKSTSEWQFYLTFKEDLIIKTVKKGTQKTFFCFGNSDDHEVFVSDFIFSIYPYNDVIIIPKEVIFKNKHNYKYTWRFGICELIRASFHNADNLYYKVPVSNFIASEELPQSESQTLNTFKTPIGKQFDPKKWEIDDISMLPVYKNVK